VPDAASGDPFTSPAFAGLPARRRALRALRLCERRQPFNIERPVYSQYGPAVSVGKDRSDICVAHVNFNGM
jgi:hypothetical protein